MLYIIDNYDSFTYNIVHYLNEIGIEVKIVLNDDMSAKDVLNRRPSHIVLSPGPGTPNDSGISKELLIMAAQENIPVLGICLGHEIIAEVFGGLVNHANKVMHGKTSIMYHNNSGPFANVQQAFVAARYHSLVVDRSSLPSCLTVSAWTRTDSKEIDEIMGLSHKTLPVHGVQFHPESIMTENGHKLLENFLNIGAAPQYFAYTGSDTAV